MKKNTYIPRENILGERYAVPNSRELAVAMASGLMKQVNETAAILNRTVDPKVFFSRYDFLIACTHRLVLLSRKVKFSGEPPQVLLDRLTDAEYRSAAIDVFVERYCRSAHKKIAGLATQAARDRNFQKYHTGLQPYYDWMYPENVSKFERLLPPEAGRG